MSTIGSLSYLIALWGLILHLMFGKPLVKRIRRLEKKERRLVKALKQISTSFVPANSQFSHNPWVLICISGDICRVCVRGFKQQVIEGTYKRFAQENPRGTYKFCFDVFGFFGDAGAIEAVQSLSADHWKMLKLDRSRFVAPETEGEAVVESVITPEIVV